MPRHLIITNSSKKSHGKTVSLSAAICTCNSPAVTCCITLILWTMCVAVFTGEVTERQNNVTLKFSGKPLHDYVVDVVDFSCGRELLCNSTVGQYDSWMCTQCQACYCDESCRLYGDCCLDKYLGDAGDPGTELSGPDLSDYISCVPPLPEHSQFFVVAKCPLYFTGHADVRNKCESPNLSDITQGTLVADVRNNVSFRNEYCARCHGVEVYTPWINSATCKYAPKLSEISSKAELWEYIMDGGRCPVTTRPPGGVASRPCTAGLVTACNHSGQWPEWNQTLELLCHNVYSPIRYIHPTVLIADRLWYKNVFCLMCDGIELDDRRGYCRPDGRTTFFPEPLSVLLDFNREGSFTKAPVNTSKCLSGNILDPFTGTCERLRCSDRRLLDDDVCIPRFSSVQWLGYVFSVTMTARDELLMSDWSNITHMYEEVVREVLAVFQPYVLTPMTLTVYMTTPGPLATQAEQRFHSLLVEGRVISAANKSTQFFERMLKSLQTDPWVAESGIKSATFYPVPSSCLAEKFLSIYEQRSVSDHHLAIVHVGHRCDEECFENVQYTNIETVLDCPYARYNMSDYSSDFSVNETSNTILFRDKALHMNSSDYYLCRDTLDICSHVIDRISEMIGSSREITPISKSQERTTLGIVSFACMIVSLASLLLTFLIYSCLGKLRTLPGKNTMALVFHLFLAQLTFLTGNTASSIPLACQIMGAFIHYFWLATFAWMAVCAYHMYKVFTDLLASRHHSLSEPIILIRFCLWANLSSLAVVLASLIYHLATSAGNQTGYGGRNCFIKHPVVLGVAFAAPVLLVLLCNIFLFIRTVLSIRNIPNMKNSTHNTNRRHVAIYFRLSALLGFTWILGFVQEIKASIYLEYLFVILSACQGIFILIAFCLNKRTLGLLKERFVSSSSKRNGSSSGPKTDSTSL